MVDKSTYVEYNQDTLDIIMDSIANNSCVLFLGPQFGETKDRNKISKSLTDVLVQNNIPIDNDFQNLFIKKEDVPPQRIALRMKNFYNSTGELIPPAKGPTTFVYRNAARISFSAIVVFGQDHFLKNAFDELGFDYDFRYYSSKGPQPVNIRPHISRVAELAMPAGAPMPVAGEEEITANPGNIPIIYNIFGSYTDPQSLITDYESYYKFLFAIMGDSGFFPRDLNARISEAQVFLFLGFDLKRWYVPLLVRKFYNIGNPYTKSMFASSMNDTDVSNNEEYVSWLGRYPLHLQPIGDTVLFFESMVATPDGEKTGLLRTSLHEKSPDQQGFHDSIDFLQKRKQWLTLLGNTPNDELGGIFDEMISFFEQKGLAEPNNFILLNKASLCTAIEDIREGTITDEIFNTKVAKIRKAVLSYINR